MRGYFAHYLHQEMKKNKKIYLITGDLGYKMWDKIRKDFPDRFINAGASEQAMMGIAVGLALENKIPFVYSITTFLLYRPFETIRNYINFEKIPVRLVGSGRGRDYSHDGITHWPEEEKQIFAIFKNIKPLWPESLSEIQSIVKKMVKINKPWYISLRR
jgi:transketolase